MLEQSRLEELLLGKCNTRPNDLDAIKLIEKLHADGLLGQQVEHFVLCDCPDDPDRHTHRGCPGKVFGAADGSFPDDEYYCDGDQEHRVLPRKKKRFHEIVTEPDHAGIDAWLEKLAAAEGLSPVRKEPGLFDVAHDGNSVIVCYVESCRNTAMLALSLSFDDAILYVYDVLPTLAPEWLDVSAATDAASLYANTGSLLKKIEEAAATPRQHSFTSAAQEFDDFRRSLPSDTAFERFCCALLKHLSDHHDQVKKYVALLRRHRNDVHGRFYTTAGGAGHPDGYYWPKYEYLQAVLEGKMSAGQIEAKRYELTSTVGNNDWFKLYGHAKDKPGILFASTNQVTGFVWENLIEVNESAGWCRFAIIPRDLLIEVIVQCRAEHLYKEDYSA